MLLGAAAQFGIFGTLLGAVGLTQLGVMDFTLREAAAISIIGGADGPTAIYVAEQLAPHLMGAIAVAAYSYMALVPLIQPPIMRLLTTAQERGIEMTQLREVSRRERILFPLVLLIVVALVLPTAAPLLGMFCFGNLMRRMRRGGPAHRYGAQRVDQYGDDLSRPRHRLQARCRPIPHQETLGVLLLGVAAFAIGTASGVLMAKGMNLVFKRPINPLIGAAGVSAVPMAARVVSRVGQEANPGNLLLMHAMGPNVAGVIGSTVAAGVLILLAG